MRKIPDLSKDELDYLIEQYIFNQKYRSVLRRRLFDGIGYEPLAEEYQMSVRQVKNIVYKSMNKIISKIK